jgi:hypothetical protein
MAPSTPTTISRYKPAVIAITIISAAYILYLLRQQVTESNELPQTQNINLHRSNAIRRHGSRRRRMSNTTEPIRSNRTVHQALATSAMRRGRGDSYGPYIVLWEEPAGDTTAVVELRVEQLRNLESLREADWPEGLWLALCEQYPRALFRAFLRAEFQAPLSNAEAVELRSMFDTDLEVPEYLHEIELFNAEMRDQRSRRIDHAIAEEQTTGNANGEAQVDGAAETVSLNALGQSLERQETVVESESDDSEDDGADRDSLNTSRNMMDLLYHIGGEQARRAYYVHRGVQCNSCGALPIQGIRYHCINCYDYDLCEPCEAGQVHIKTHVFLKIRLPGPTRGGVKEVTPTWYPGKPEMTRESLPSWVSKGLLRDVKIDKTELDALYDQFRSLAGASYEADSLGIGMAIDRAGFDQYFAVSGKSRHSPPLLVYDRIFAFYDTNNDGLIDFEEFVKGLMNLQDDSRDSKLRRIFRGYDLDDDGYVDRKDFLRMFRSYYAYIKEINRDVVSHLEEDYTSDGLRELLASSQPISAAFTGAIPHGHSSRAGLAKEQDANGDLVIQDQYGTLADDSEPHEDRSNVIVAAALGSSSHLRTIHTPRSFRPQSTRDRPTIVRDNDSVVEGRPHRDETTRDETAGDDPENADRWPPIFNLTIETADIMAALGREIPLEDITDPLDRSKVLQAQAERLDLEYDRETQERANNALRERWRRRQFYTDQEEGMSRPLGYTEEDSSDEEKDMETSEPNSAFVSRRPSMRSRSSSKVRFEDSLTDNEFETRSNTSSRSIPVNERWGGFELSEAEREIGKEILYQTVQQSYNEVLDILFKEKEDLSLSARRTRAGRDVRADEIREYVEGLKQGEKSQDDALRAADMLRTEELFATAVNGDARMSPNLNIDPETASIASQNALIESTDDGSISVQDLVNGLSTRPDLTMPQFRPDHDSTSETRADPTLPQNRPDHSSPPPPTVTILPKIVSKPRQPLSEATLAWYVTHDAHDMEVRERGGPGRISFEEFAAKMIEDQGDEVEKALGRLEKDEHVEGKWPKTAGLGKLQFIGAWLDWASF